MSENLPNIKSVQRYLETCEGCYMFEHAMECRYLDKFLAEVCPCQICLVKCMCESSCKEFDLIDDRKIICAIE
jgi:hypothetical protein